MLLYTFFADILDIFALNTIQNYFLFYWEMNYISFHILVLQQKKFSINFEGIYKVINKSMISDHYSFLQKPWILNKKKKK